MIITVNGQVHRLYFSHDTTYRSTRYPAFQKDTEGIGELEDILQRMESILLAGQVPSAGTRSWQGRINALRNYLLTDRTVCKLDIVAGVGEDGKRLWVNVAEGVVYRKHGDTASKSEAALYAFRALLKNLHGVYDAGLRQQIASQYLATRPRKATVASLKRENAALRRQIEQMQKDVFA